MKRYKGLIIVLIILLGYFLLMYFLFNGKSSELNNNQNNNINNQNSDNNEYYFVINNNNYKYKDNKIISTKKEEIESIKEYNVFIDNNYKGKFSLKYGGRYNLFNEKLEYVDYSGSLLAYQSNFNVVVRNINIREIQEQDKIFLINNYDLNTFDYLVTNQVVDIDLDSDGREDQIICLSSLKESDKITNYYNLVIVKLNDKIYKLVDERGQNTLGRYAITSVINILDNEVDSIIITRVDGESERANYKDFIYQYKNSNYVID